MTKIYKGLNILKLNELYKIELAKIMHQLHNNSLPKVIFDLSVSLDIVHNHNTRQLQKTVYFFP